MAQVALPRVTPTVILSPQTISQETGKGVIAHQQMYISKAQPGN